MNFHGGTMISAASAAPLGATAGYLLLDSGNIWIGVAFLAISMFSALLMIATLTRYVINIRRQKII
jgi:hypothetical protein